MTTERNYRALLIGCGRYYRDSTLPELYGPPNDVTRLAGALSDPDWGLHDPTDILQLRDASKTDIEAAMEEFFTGASRQDQLFFYYSGHGIHEVRERLFLGASDTKSDRPHSTAIAVELLNTLAGTTKAAATAIVLDCCYSGIMKGPALAHALDSRGRWTLVSSRRDQQSADARTPDGVSAFTNLVCEALIANAEIDVDHDGYVTMTDVNRYVGPRLTRQTGQDATFLFDGSGELVVALAPGYDVEFDQARNWVERPGGGRLVVPDIPKAGPAVERSTAEEAQSAEGSAEASSLAALSPMAASEQLLDALEAGRQITVRRALQGAARDAIRLVEADQGWDELGDVLDRLACIAAAFLNHRSNDWLEATVTTLVRIYESGFDSQGLTKPDGRIAGGVTPAELWLSLYERVLALGALAVRTEQWGAVRLLAMQRPDGLDFRHYNNWLRHAFTMAARANLLRVERDGRFEDRSVLAVVSEYIQQHECLRPDLHVGHEDRVVASLCQFDALGCVAAIATAGSLDRGNFYPNFSRFYSERTEPIVRRLISDETLRAQVAPIADDDLSIVLKGLSEAALNEGMRFNGWSGFHDPTINAWLERMSGSAS